MDAVVLAELDSVGAAPALVVALLFVVVVVVPPGGLAVELQPARTSAAAAGVTASTAKRSERSRMSTGMLPRFFIGWCCAAMVQPGTCCNRLVMPSSRPRSHSAGWPPLKNTVWL